mgnify:CR=1 FL=1
MRVVMYALLASLVFASSALAEGQDSCSQSCPSGQVLVSFADGNNATCVCQEIGAAMEDSPVSEINCSDPEDDGSCE